MARLSFFREFSVGETTCSIHYHSSNFIKKPFRLAYVEFTSITWNSPANGQPPLAITFSVTRQSDKVIDFYILIFSVKFLNLRKWKLGQFIYKNTDYKNADQKFSVEKIMRTTFLAIALICGWSRI